MICPRCGSPFKAYDTAEAGQLDVCTGCEALWLPHDLLAAYVKQRLVDEGYAKRVANLLEMPPVPTEQPCPSCGLPAMEKLKVRGIEVERCHHCKGVFLDAGEIECITERVLYSAEEARFRQERLAGESRRLHAYSDGLGMKGEVLGLILETASYLLFRI